MRQVGGQRAYARHRGCTHRAVQVAIASGRISTLAGGKLDFAVADREWRENTNLIHRPPRQDDSPELRRVRTAWLSSRVALLAFEYQRLRDRLVPIEQVRQERAELAARVRARLLEIPGRVVLRRREATDDLAAHALLESEIVRALVDLAGEPEDAPLD